LFLAANEGETAFQFCGEVGAFRGDSHPRQGRFSSLRLPMLTTDEVREASENLHQRAATIRLGLALDHFDGSKSAQDGVCQRIIEFRKNAKTLPEEERTRLEKRIADYSNALV